jgi:hypothetical protein
MLPPCPDAAPGDTVSFRPGSSSRRALGGFSTVELRVVPFAGAAGGIDGGTDVPEPGVSTSDGTEVTVPPPTSSVTVALEPPQLVHGAETTAAGRAKIGRYDWRLWLQPAPARAATARAAIFQTDSGRTTNEASLCRAIIILLARFNACPTSQVGSQCHTGCKWDADSTIDVLTKID